MKRICAVLVWATLAPAVQASPVDAVADQAKFNGIILIGRGERIIYERSFGTAAPAGKKPFKPSNVWRWASVTKQVTATLVMQEVAAGRMMLDAPLTRYLPAFAGPAGGSITIRQLLRHQSGLPNPNATPAGPSGVPGYYAGDDDGGTAYDRSPATGYCAGPPVAEVGGRVSYNNCDYIVLGAVLEAVTRQRFDALVQTRLARPLGLRSVGVFETHLPKPATVPGFEADRPAAAFSLPTFAAAGALYGTARDLFRFDRALLAGTLLPAAERAEMWDGRPELGFAALGAWSYRPKLKHCAAPVQLIERYGDIGGVQVRNFLLPEQDMVMIVFTNRAETQFGEIWQGAGLSHDLLDAAVCMPHPRT